MVAGLSSASAYRRLSLWLDTVPGSLSPRPAVDRDLDVDVAVVGAGYTGLWTAYYLARLDPSLRIAVVEKEIAGFGASGRNGGWCSAQFAPSKTKVARLGGRDGAMALQRAQFDTVDEVGRVAAEEGIECDFAKGGTLVLARTPVQAARLRAEVAEERSWGFGAGDVRWLPAAEAAARVAATGVLGGTYTPHCAALHPARLVRGLAAAVERRGVAVYERTPALRLDDGVVETPGGRLRQRSSSGRPRVIRLDCPGCAGFWRRSTR